MLGYSSSPLSKNSAFVVRVSDSHGNQTGQLWCDHCQKPHHTKENCWKLHGKPANWTPSRARGQDAIGLQLVHEPEAEKTNPGMTMTLSKEQMEQLCKYLSVQQFTAGSQIVQKGVTLTAFSGMIGKGEPWIIDS